MSGPRVTTGSDSKQDYATPPEFMEAVAKRFGPVTFDLAAHRGNHRHASYFAPPALAETIDGAGTREAVIAVAATLERQGADPGEVQRAIDAVDWKAVPIKNGKRLAKISVPNRDPDAVAFDSLARPWALPGLLWLNPPFDDIAPWAAKCAREAKAGACVAFLVPAAVGANWYRDHVAPHAITHFLNGRICFDGKNGYPKDCLLALFGGGPGIPRIWTWERDVMHAPWGAAA